MRLLFALAFGIFTLISVPAILRAQETPAQTTGEARARKLHQAGERFYRQGQYAEALDAFEQAYEAAARPNLLFSQAQTHRKIYAGSGDRAHKQKAIELYRAFLRSVSKGEYAVQATAALEALGPIEDTAPVQPLPPPPETSPEREPPPAPKTKTTLAIDSSAEGAMISVDGGPPAPPQVSAVVTEGRHTVKVTAPGYVSKEVVVQAIVGQITPETIELDEMPATLDVKGLGGDYALYVDGVQVITSGIVTVRPGVHFVSTTMNGRSSVGKEVTASRGTRSVVVFHAPWTVQRYAAIAILGASGAALVAAGVTLGLAADSDARAAALDAQRKAQSIGAPDFADYAGLKDQRDLFRLAGFATLGAGAAASAVGLTMLFFDRPSPIAPPMGKEGPRPRPPEHSPLDEPFVVVPIAGPDEVALCVRARF